MSHFRQPNVKWPAVGPVAVWLNSQTQTILQCVSEHHKNEKTNANGTKDASESNLMFYALNRKRQSVQLSHPPPSPTWKQN